MFVEKNAKTARNINICIFVQLRNMHFQSLRKIAKLTGNGNKRISSGISIFVIKSKMFCNINFVVMYNYCVIILFTIYER